jgi:mannose-6-phosphate isomerase-like protein (cupin superfamily)
MIGPMTNTATDTGGSPPILVRAGRAETLDGDPKGSIALLVDSEPAGGVLTSHRSTFGQGSDGAPPHYHKRSAELFFVLGGSLQVLLEQELVTLGAGDFLLVPPGTPHAFAPPHGQEAEVLFVFAPGVPRDDYYRLLDRLYRGDADPQEIQATQERFDNFYVDSEIWTEARAAS